MYSSGALRPVDMPMVEQKYQKQSRYKPCHDAERYPGCRPNLFNHRAALSNNNGLLRVTLNIDSRMDIAHPILALSIFIHAHGNAVGHLVLKELQAGCTNHFSSNITLVVIGNLIFWEVLRAFGQHFLQGLEQMLNTAPSCSTNCYCSCSREQLLVAVLIGSKTAAIETIGFIDCQQNRHWLL